MKRSGIALAALLASTAFAHAAFLTGDLEIGGGTNTISITGNPPPTGTIIFNAGSSVLASGTTGNFVPLVGDAVTFPAGTLDFNTLTAHNPFLTINGLTFDLATETVSITPIGIGNSTFDISGTGTFVEAGFTNTPGQFTYSSQSIGGVFTNTSFSASALAVPGPIVGAGLPGLLSLVFAGGVWWRKRRNARCFA